MVLELDNARGVTIVRERDPATNGAAGGTVEWCEQQGGRGDNSRAEPECRTAPGSAWMSEWRAAIGAGTARRTRLPRGRRQWCCVHATRVATRREATTKREADGGGRASHAVRRGSAQSLAPSHVGTASMALRPDGTRRTTNGTHARYLELNPPWRTYREHEQREPGAASLGLDEYVTQVLK